MTKELYEWLKFRWSRDNHNKYQHLFSEWIENITPAQIEGFSKQEKRRNIYNS
jgi:hypothetical protein